MFLWLDTLEITSTTLTLPYIIFTSLNQSHQQSPPKVFLSSLRISSAMSLKIYASMISHLQPLSRFAYPINSLLADFSIFHVITTMEHGNLEACKLIYVWKSRLPTPNDQKSKHPNTPCSLV